MSGDYSRERFDQFKDYSSVRMQQGRVQLDADWNELGDLLDRRWRAETTDIIGRAVVPTETPDGFRIQIAAGLLTIGRGRMYVDGLLAENHGKAPLEFDPILAEQRGTLPVPYNEQPYFPNVAIVNPAPTSGGPHLVCLDVWEREVTHLQDPELVEKAVGVDTTTRMQTVWQVRVLANVGAGTTCGSFITAWDSLIAPSSGRLSSAAVGVETASDPCLIPPSGGYRGLDNRLYRIEVHDGGVGGSGGVATFKWSRDNASVASAVTAITALDKITVASIGRDSVMRFRIGDWIEITDDRREFARQSGVMVQVKSVDSTNQVITLTVPLPVGSFPTDAQGNTLLDNHTRIRRWDQSGQVRDTNDTLLVDLNAPSSTGVIPVPATGTSIVLEDGVQITFNTAAGGVYRIGDYWNFAARKADASVESLHAEPPRGVHHHYARLALVTFPDTVTNCRILWPPSIPDGGDNCACTVCVTPQTHANGQLTIQMAVDQVRAAGGGTVCLEVGNFSLQTPVQIQDARSVKLIGKGIASQLVAAGATGAVVIISSQDIVLDSFSILYRGTVSSPQEAVRVVDSRLVRIEHLAIRGRSAAPSWTAIGLAGALMTLTVRGNVVQSPIGIRSGGNASGAEETGLSDVRIENNEFDCDITAIAFSPVTVHLLLNRIYGNRINGCREGGLLLNGVTTPGFGLDVQANVFSVLGHGIVASLSGLRVLDNDLLWSAGGVAKEPCGIWLDSAPTDKDSITDCQILGNRIQGFAHTGIRINAPVRSVMIKQNQISRVGIGLRLEPGQVVDQVSIENNQFRDISGLAINGAGSSANYVVTGNQIRKINPGPVVNLSFLRGDGIFSHNECYCVPAPPPPGLPPPDVADVSLNSRTLIVCNNRVVGGPISIVIILKERSIVLGNICAGTIEGQVLPNQRPLNLENVG